MPGIALSQQFVHQRVRAAGGDRYGYSQQWPGTSALVPRVRSEEQRRRERLCCATLRRARDRPLQRYHRSAAAPPPALAGNPPARRRSSTIQPVCRPRGQPPGLLQTWHWAPRKVVLPAGDVHSEIPQHCCSRPPASPGRFFEPVYREFRELIAALRHT